MSLSLIERETIINFNATQEDASVFTAQPEVWRRLEKIEGFKLVRTERLEGKACGKEFYCSKPFVRSYRGGLIIGRPIRKGITPKRVDSRSGSTPRRGVLATSDTQRVSHNVLRGIGGLRVGRVGNVF